MKDKLVVITGGTGGIGKEAAVGLGKLGARLILVGRDEARGKAAVDEVKERSGARDVKLELADLGLMVDTKRLAEALKSAGKIDVLLNNAGAIFMRRYETAEKLEKTFALNHASYFILANLLLAAGQIEGRIVNVASGAHTRGRLDLDDLQSTKSYAGIRVYSTSKLMNIMFAAELARRLDPKKVVTTSLHPGAVATTWGRTDPSWFKVIITIGRPFLISAQKGALTPIYCSSAPEIDAAASGQYFYKCRAVRPSQAARDEAAQLALWERTEEITGVRGPARLAAPA